MATVSTPRESICNVHRVPESEVRTVLRSYLAAESDPEQRWEPTPSNDIWFTTIGGNKVSLLAPQPAAIDINEIAHSLSQLCRFNGHSKVFYSVADHCVHVSKLVPPKLAMVGLLHDAGEAYLSDLPSPVKKMMAAAESGEYKAAEGRLWEAICQRFGLRPKSLAKVKRADLIAMATEKRDLFDHDLHDGCEGIEPDVMRLCEYRGKNSEFSPLSSRGRFLARFHAIAYGCK